MTTVSTYVSEYGHLSESDPYKDRQEYDNQLSLFTRLKNIISLSEVLRVFGALAVIASMSLFLLNGWTEGNDIQRYLKLLAQTGLLTIAGFVMSYVLKENKGARLFFALALMSVVANFTILGALIYSMIQLDGVLIDYPSMVTWTVVSAGSFWPVFIGAVIGLALLARFSLSIFARSIAGPLSLGFLAINALLLIPVRSSILISVVAATGFVSACLLVKKLSGDEQVVWTKETKFAFALLFVSPVLIVARAVSLYSVDEVLLVLLSGVFYCLLRFIGTKLSAENALGSLQRLFQYCAGLVLAFSLVALIPGVFDEFFVPIFSLLAILLCIDQLRLTKNEGSKQLFFSITTLLVVFINVILVVANNDLLIQGLNSMICIGLFYLATRYVNGERQYKAARIVSALGALVCLGALILNIVQLINLGNWMLVGIAGAVFIVLGSLYERFGLKIDSLFSTKDQSEC